MNNSKKITLTSLQEEKRMKRKLSLALIVMLAIMLMLGSTVSATQTHTYNIGRILADPYSFNGFWCRTVLPTLNSGWTSGTENKINCEFWHPINTGGGKNWVEMGYHSGYSFNSDGSPNTNAFYSGCFTSRATSSSWRMDTFGSLGWAAGQTHTMGNMFNNLGTSWSCDMRTDDTIIITYGSSAPGGNYSTDCIDVGFEWGVSNSASQSATKPTTFTDLNIYMWQDTGGKVWKKWSDIGGGTSANTHSGYTATYNSATNVITINYLSFVQMT